MANILLSPDGWGCHEAASGDLIEELPPVELLGDGIHIATAYDETVIQVWDCPRAWERRHGQEDWRPCEPEIDLGLRGLRSGIESLYWRLKRENADFLSGQESLRGVGRPTALRKYDHMLRNLVAYEKGFTAIPQTVRTAIAPFPEGHFRLLRFVAECPGGLDLILSTPALAFAVANNERFMGGDAAAALERAKDMVRMRQRFQAARLGFGGGRESAVRILRKAPKDLCTVKLLKRLRRILGDADCTKPLSHVPVINGEVLDILEEPRARKAASPNLLEEVGLSDEDGMNEIIATKVLAIAELASRLGRELPAHSLRSFWDLDAMEAELQHTILIEMAKNGRGCPFPSPPLEGTQEIVPLASYASVLREAREQGHCLAAYLSGILRGGFYAYAVAISGTRATALVSRVRDEDGISSWRLQECKEAGNAQVPDAVAQAVEEWVAKCQGLRRDEMQLLLPSLWVSNLRTPMHPDDDDDEPLF